MTNKLKAKGHNFFWGEKQQRNFDKLKVAIATAPILVIFYPHKPFVVEIDASSTTIGVVLLQDGRPIAFYHQKQWLISQTYKEIHLVACMLG